MDDRKGGSEQAAGVAGNPDLGHGNTLRPHQRRVADDGEGRLVGAQRFPGGGHDLRPDAGGFAQRQDQRRDRWGHLNSIRASLRRSRR